MTEPVLRVENLSKAFPGLQALDKVSIEVRAHEVVGLVGENGAGKSTLLKVLAGLYQPDSGVITLRARPVSHRNVAEAAEGGIGMVFQEQSLLPNVTVAENILLGHEGGGVRHGLYRWSHLYDQASAQLAKLGSSLLPNAQTDSLSFAERQVVELAKVLAIEERTRHEPVILLDEPTSILEAEDVDMVLDLIGKLRERASVVFVSHRLDEVLRVSDRVYVMTNGRCVAERRPENCDIVELQQLMLGRELSTEYGKRGQGQLAAGGPMRLSVQKLRCDGAFDDISFDIHAGEVLGIAGVQGSGREALCRALFGAQEAHGGRILLNGQPMRFDGPAAAVRAGIGYVPAERRVEGIIAGLSVRENMTLAYLRAVMRGPRIDFKRERTLALSWIERLRIKTPSPETPVGNLSGGNQQKVALTKWLIGKNCQVLILDHPMRGLDVGAKAEILALIRELASSGMAIILIADTLEELIALSTAVIVMRDGRISGRFGSGEAPPTQLQILELMV
jgi:ribose transport system ATP-binding protein